ncbi:MAG: transporter associated domain-containing protein, partial [Planctomycetota bacterium]
ADLGGKPTPSGYVLVTESDSEEIAGAIPLKHMPTAPRSRLEQFAQPVAYVPWCATVSAILEQFQLHRSEVAVVLNEWGETIGVVTLEDILETVFEVDASRSARLLAVSSIEPAGEGRWHVTGMTSLRRLCRHFQVPLQPIRSATVAGLLQEHLQRLPVAGDETLWAGFRLRVIEVVDDAPAKVELQLDSAGGPLP